MLGTPFETQRHLKNIYIYVKFTSKHALIRLLRCVFTCVNYTHVKLGTPFETAHSSGSSRNYVLFFEHQRHLLSVKACFYIFIYNQTQMPYTHDT
jgi:hypothetical protein